MKTAPWIALFLAPYSSYALSEVIKVAVLDTGLDLKDPRFSQVLCKSGHKAYHGEALDDLNGHGTHVTGIIQKYAGGSSYCLVIYKVFEDGGGSATDNIISAIRDAITQGVSVINMSFGGPSYNEYERLTMAAARNAIFVVAAGNEGWDLSAKGYYPASYGLPNMRVVGALGYDGKILRSSNYGRPVRFWEPGEIISTLPNDYQGLRVGTSMAAAVQTGKLVKELQRAQVHH